MKKLPILLIYFRLVIGLLLLPLAYFAVSNFAAIAIIIIAAGLISDIFDGIIARKYHVSTEKLRRLDSSIDQVFWISVIGALYIHCPAFFQAHKTSIFVLMGAEAATYLVSYARFGKEIATHAISSKLWTLSLFATIIQIAATCQSGILFQVCFYVGMLTRLENIAILLLLKEWTNDVPSAYHAFQLRRGKEIKRNKLFNGKND
ncbi:MAG: CDP-alcohol phosphatidyltransferase [Sphingobacteriales bacterium]|nr:MAG: CDP-alcohol phosphatidyltransferase [Sphingobacteriales bacterium]